MSKWEYCVVGPIKNNLEGYYPKLVYLTAQGPSAVGIRPQQGASEPEVLAMTLAQLGEEGWEMVSCGAVPFGTENDCHVIYFKRMKE